MTVSTEAFMQSFVNLEAVQIGRILDDNEYYLNHQKSAFMGFLVQCFNSFRRAGDTKLDIKPGRCTFPSDNVSSYTFVGNNSSNYIELNIHNTDSILTGLTECYCFSSEPDHRAVGVRIYIDPKRGSTL